MALYAADQKKEDPLARSDKEQSKRRNAKTLKSEKRLQNGTNKFWAHCGGGSGDGHPREESFALPFSSVLDEEFDAVVGYLEDIIMDDKFQLLQRNFKDKYYQKFKDTEENKLLYTPIFNEFSLVEKYIEEQLLEWIPGFNTAAFTTLLHHKDEVAGDVFDMLLTFMDFLAFKEMFLDYRAEKEGQGLDLSSGLVVTSSCKSSSTPAFQNSLWH
ncbi:ADP-ribosylation factor-like protein 2-binding protein [Cynocephalus volans]|uniref:ADP-ribosylation factor-like protein 2-binding protein n=1 Tax=Cynocephalus volans TaxID=110931 RepID=UPI002FC63FA1